MICIKFFASNLNKYIKNRTEENSKRSVLYDTKFIFTNIAFQRQFEFYLLLFCDMVITPEFPIH